MPLYHARVRVTLKPTVNDPQGRTVMGALKSLGFAEVQDVRIGKFIEIRLEAADEEGARKRVDEMCARLLANPVIERYDFDLQVVEPATADEGS